MASESNPSHRADLHPRRRSRCHDTPFNQLRRTVATCMLWEDRFYEDGEQWPDPHRSACTAYRSSCCVRCSRGTAMKLRHVPLLIVRDGSSPSEAGTLRRTSTLPTTPHGSARRWLRSSTCG